MFGNINEFNKVNFSLNKTNLSFCTKLEFIKDDKSISILPQFVQYSVDECRDMLDSCNVLSSYVMEDSDFIITKEIAYNSDMPYSFRTRMKVKNKSDQTIFLKKLTPFFIENLQDIDLGGTDSTNWIFYRQGRHKNDLPSVCKLGVKDDSFFDAVGGLLETGGVNTEGRNNTSQLISDQLTVIKASEHSEEGITIGFLTGYNQMVECILSLDEDNNFSKLSASCIFDVDLETGREVESEWIRIDCRPNTFEAIEEYAKDKARIYKARKGEKIPSVFCTWYYYGLTVTYEDIKTNLYELKNKKIPFDVYQVDEGWEITLGDWRANSKFPVGMKAVADEIKSQGFTAGIWTSPFIAHATAPIVYEHPEWLLCHSNGERCLFPMNNTVYYVFDITNPEVVQWVEDLYKMIRREWGYTYHKLDFTRAPVVQKDAVYYDRTITLAEAYRRAVEAVRRGVGEDGYILMCGGLYDPIIGIVDAQRIGSDVLSMWSDPIRKGGKAAPFTIKQNVLRYWMNYWWDNDPDALMVRRQSEPIRNLHLSYGLLTDEEVKTVALNQYFGGGLVCSTEPMAQIDKDRLYVLRHVMPVVKTKTIPRDIFSGSRYPSVIDVEIEEKGWHTVCIINWDDEADIECSVVLNEKLVGDFAKEHGSFIVSEFYSGKIIKNVKYGDQISLGIIKSHGSILFKIVPQNMLPAIVHSTAHYSMGGEVTRLAIINNRLEFEINYPFDFDVTYKVKLPVGRSVTKLPENTTMHGEYIEFALKGIGDYKFVVELG